MIPVSHRTRLRVVARDASRTGVPIVLVRYLRWLREHTATAVDVVVRFDGPMRHALAAAADSVTVLEPRGRPKAAAALRATGRPRAAARLEDANWRLATRHLPHPDIGLLHGAGAWPLRAALPTEVVTVGHLHELDYALDRSWSVPGRPALFTPFAGLDAVMVVDGSVAEAAHRRGADPELLRIVPGCLAPSPSARVPASSASLETSPWVATSPTSGAPPGRVTVMGLGEPGWRKGTDRFVAMAAELRRRAPEVGCVWVGGRPTGRDAYAVGTPVDRGDVVTWVDSTETPWRAPLPDVFVLSSREDPLPLVALEAAELGIPVVATASGGAEGVFADGRGVVVPPGSPVSSLCDAVLGVVEDPIEARRRADRAARFVVEHFAVDVVAREWWDVLAHTLMRTQGVPLETDI